MSYDENPSPWQLGFDLGRNSEPQDGPWTGTHWTMPRNPYPPGSRDWSEFRNGYKEGLESCEGYGQ